MRGGDAFLSAQEGPHEAVYVHPRLESGDDVPVEALDRVLDQIGQYESDIDPLLWLPVIAEEMGRLAHSVRNDGPELLSVGVGIAAASVAMVECAIRNGWEVQGAQ